MKLLDDLSRRKQIKKLLEEIEAEIDNISTIDDVKFLLEKLIKQMKKML